MLWFKRSHIDICLEHDSSASGVYSGLYYESILPAADTTILWMCSLQGEARQKLYAADEDENGARGLEVFMLYVSPLTF